MEETNTNTEIRRPSAAGSFYPANQVELAKQIAGFFASVEKRPLAGRPMGLVVPHAGYQYSGRIAAQAYKLLVGEQFDTVVIVSPSHAGFFKGSSVYTGAGYKTPLGVVEVDHELAEQIATINPSVHYSNMGHASGSTRGEHALEVQLPFLQTVLGKFKLVPIVMGDQEEDSIKALGEVLASTLVRKNCLMIASTDLSHFHPEAKARRLDKAVQMAVSKFDADLLMETLETGRGEACGGGPMAVVMAAAKRLGGADIKLLDYTTSAETTGDMDEVVGYMSAAIVEGKKVRTVNPLIGSAISKMHEPDVVSEEDQQCLLKIAHDAIRAKLDDRNYTSPERESLQKKKGVFVTLHLDGHLRGCIGRIKARAPLSEVVAEMAVAAAFEDPRFMPLTEEDFGRLQIEISVLSKLKRIYEKNEIEIGRDGLMILLDMHSGLLLPQVATDHEWDAQEFLEQICLKASLPIKSYKDSSAEIYRFTTETFSTDV